MEAKYVVLDGMDGSGKGTQIKFLEKKLQDVAVFTREPGGSAYAEEIRKNVRDNPLAATSTPLCLFLQFFAAREDALHNLVMPALAEGKHVFSDRGDSSTFAFQLCGEQHQELMSEFLSLRSLVYNKIYKRREPDLYLVFDLPAEVARERALKDASRTQTHFDVRPLEYYEHVREGFRRFAGMFPTEIIDATPPPHIVHRSVMMALAERLIIPEFAMAV